MQFYVALNQLVIFAISQQLFTSKSNIDTVAQKHSISGQLVQQYLAHQADIKEAAHEYVLKQ